METGMFLVPRKGMLLEEICIRLNHIKLPFLKAKMVEYH